MQRKYYYKIELRVIVTLASATEYDLVLTIPLCLVTIQYIYVS